METSDGRIHLEKRWAEGTKVILDSVRLMPCHPSNRGGSRPIGAIQYLAFHYTGNDGDHDTNNAIYYRDNIVKASAHYFVDDDSVTQSVEDTGIAWAVGGKRWADTAQTGGGKLFLKATNYNTLSIEMCDTNRDGHLMATEATMARAAELGRALMAKYNIPIERVIRHFDVTGKHCPAYFMDEAAWATFKARLTEPEEETMKLYHYVAEMPEWAREAATKAIRRGIVKMDAEGAVTLWEPNLQPLVWMDRMGLLDKPAAARGGN